MAAEGLLRQSNSESTTTGEEFTTLFIPDVGGGTRYQSDDNLIGIAEWLEKLKVKPNFVTINGGLIPFIPQTGTVRYRDVMLSLRKGINNPNDAAAVIKVHMDRILTKLPDTTDIIYAMGRNDEKNINLIADRLVNESAFNQHILVKRIVDTEMAISARVDIISDAEENKEALQKLNKSSPSIKRELDNVIVKIALNKEELSEFKERRKSLAELYQLSIQRLMESEARKVKKGVEKELAKITDEELQKKLFRELYAPLLTRVGTEEILKELSKVKMERAALRSDLRAYSISPIALEYYLNVLMPLIEKENRDRLYKAEQTITSSDARKALASYVSQGNTRLKDNASAFARYNRMLEDCSFIKITKNKEKGHQKENILTPMWNLSKLQELVSKGDKDAKVKSITISPEALEEMGRRAKFLGNESRILNIRGGESTEEASVLETAEKNIPALIYTKNIPVTPAQEALIRDTSFSYYLSALKNATGRKRNVTIQTDTLHIYPIKHNGASFNIIVASTLDNITKVFKKTTNTEAPMRLGRVVENAVGLKTLEGTETNIFTTSGNMYSSVALDPIRDWSPSLIISNPTGTLWSLKALSDLANQKIRTRETEAHEKGLLDSSASIWRYNPKTKAIEHEVLTTQFLQDRRKERDVTVEKEAIDKILSKKNGKNGDEEQLTGIKEDLEQARINCMTPSELQGRKRELAILRRSENFAEQLRSLAPHANEPLPQEPKKMKMILFGDIHFGNKIKHELIEAAAKDALDKKPDVVFFNGDTIEGNLWNFKNVARSIDLPEHADDYEKSLRNSGMSEADIQKEMLRFRKSYSESSPIQSIDAQISLFNDIFMPLIGDVLERGGIVVLGSGNHYNMTTRRWEFDEATTLFYAVRNHMKAHEEDGTLGKGWEERVKLIPGSEYGAGDLNIDGLQVHTAHLLEDKIDKMESFMETKRTIAALIIASHFHKHQEVKTDKKLIVETLPMKDTVLDPYLSRIPTVAHVVDGYVVLEVEVRDGEIISYKTRPIIERELRARGLQPEDPHMKFVDAQQIVRLEHNLPQHREKSKVLA